MHKVLLTINPIYWRKADVHSATKTWKYYEKVEAVFYWYSLYWGYYDNTGDTGDIVVAYLKAMFGFWKTLLSWVKKYIVTPRNQKCVSND